LNDIFLFLLPRFIDENQDDESKPPTINGYAVPIREGTTRSGRPGQRSMPMDIDEGPGPAGDIGQEGVRESIQEEDEVGELGGSGPLIPPPQGFRGMNQQGGRALSQSVPQVGITRWLFFFFFKFFVESGTS
jgi:hypothetical protein